jgi:hypothetical protein
MVLRCKYTNGSVATYAIHTNDKTLYFPGDTVEVENPGYPNDYVKVVDAIVMTKEDPGFPTRMVIQKIIIVPSAHMFTRNPTLTGTPMNMR